jgi:hypothetical protein
LPWSEDRNLRVTTGHNNNYLQPNPEVIQWLKQHPNLNNNPALPHRIGEDGYSH